MARLTTGKEGRRIFNFAIPILLGNIFQQLYQIIDIIFIGKFVGKEAMASAGASFPIIFLLVSLIIGITSGSTTVIAQNYGGKNYDNVHKAINSLYAFLLYASAFVCILGIVFSKPILRMIQLPEELIPSASLFMNIFMLSMPLQFFFNGISAILRGLGDSKTPMYFIIITTLLNIILAFVFVVILEWGVAGAAWATVVANGLTTIALIIYLNKNNTMVRFRIKEIKIHKKIFQQSFRIGLPAGLQQSFVALGMLALNSIVNPFGTDVIASYTAATRVETFATMPAMNFSLALAAFVGQNLGANRIDRIYRGLKSTLLTTGAITLGLSALIIIFGRSLLSLFLSEPDVIDIGYEYLSITGSFYIIFCIMQVYTSVMRGAGDTLIPMFITLFSLWIVRIPIALFLSREIGPAGIWWAIPIGWSIGMLCSILYYKSGRWKTKAVVKFDANITKIEEV